MAKKRNYFENPGQVEDVALHQVTRDKFLNYAVSVISSRALPDVRDGLKPVQRRILYTMYSDLKLLPEKKTLKCAKVVGQVLGNYHPHGDGAVYEALVRMAQPWSMRYPLIYGQGNFGSLDGDSAAAYRYTEAKLEPLAVEFLGEIREDTVDFIPNFDDTDQEPEVLPSKVPELLVNGCTGIAVGVATNIPPHNLKEVLGGCCALIENPEISIEDLMKKVKGPDFPSGGEILEDRKDLLKMYESGQGRVRVRGEYTTEEGDTRNTMKLVVHSIPYMVNKGSLLEQLGNLVLEKKVPQLLDVRDESTEEIRIVLECKKGCDPENVMAYLYKHTTLQDNFHVNMTCLVPCEGVRNTRPERVSLLQALNYFNEFRYGVVVRRLEYELAQIQKRIHVLNGFVIVFDGLDEAIRIIRESNGRRDAADKLKIAFPLDEDQVQAVLDLKLYRLGRPDILKVRQELEECLKREAEIQETLSSASALWGLVSEELQDISERFGDPRRSKIRVSGVEELEYKEESFIVQEDAVLLFTQDGWLRRVGVVSDLTKVRLRQGDELVSAWQCSTLDLAVFFSDLGVAYSVRVSDIPLHSRSLGEPIQSLFNFQDGEKVVGCIVVDPKSLGALVDKNEPEKSACKLFLATSDGKGYFTSLESYLEPSTKAGRRYAKPAKGSKVIEVGMWHDQPYMGAVSRFGRALVFASSEMSFLSGVGRGVNLLKLDKEDRLITLKTLGEGEFFEVIREDGGRAIRVGSKHQRVTGRAGKGATIAKRGLLRKLAGELELQSTLSSKNIAGVLS